jgi:hypothetical protein
MKFNKNELTILFNFLNRFLRNFELDFLEKNFWKDIYKLDDLANVRNKIRDVLDRA